PRGIGQGPVLCPGRRHDLGEVAPGCAVRPSPWPGTPNPTGGPTASYTSWGRGRPTEIEIEGSPEPVTPVLAMAECARGGSGGWEPVGPPSPWGLAQVRGLSPVRPGVGRSPSPRHPSSQGTFPEPLQLQRFRGGEGGSIAVVAA